MKTVSPPPVQLFVSHRGGTDGPGSERIGKKAPTTAERKGLTSKAKLLQLGNCISLPPLVLLTRAAQI